MQVHTVLGDSADEFVLLPDDDIRGVEEVSLVEGRGADALEVHGEEEPIEDGLAPI